MLSDRGNICTRRKVDRGGKDCVGGGTVCAGVNGVLGSCATWTGALTGGRRVSGGDDTVDWPHASVPRNPPVMTLMSASAPSTGRASGIWRARSARRAPVARRVRLSARRRLVTELSLRDEIRPASLPGKVRTLRAGAHSPRRNRWPFA